MSRRASLVLPAGTTSDDDPAHPINETPRLRKDGSFKRGENCGSFENIEIEIGTLLGGGTQGTVYNAVIFYTQDGEEHTYKCVAKLLKDPSNLNAASADIPTEMRIHQHISDTVNLPSAQSGLLRIIGVYEDQGRTYALLPRCEATLKDLIENINSLEKNNQNLHNHLMFQLLSSMTDGLTHLESMGLSHGDLKPDNIGLREITTGFNQQGLKKEHHFCMLDFGSVTQPEATLLCSPLYMSPELCGYSEKPTIQSDIWAIGGIFRQLRGESISDGCTEPEQIFFKRGNAYKTALEAEKKNPAKSLEKEPLIVAIERASSFSDALNQLIVAMSETLPEKRPSIETLQLARDQLTALLPDITARDKLRLDHYLLHGMPSQTLTPGLSRAQTTDSFGGIAETFDNASRPIATSSSDKTVRREPSTPKNLTNTQPTPKPTPEKLDPGALATGNVVSSDGTEPRTAVAARHRTADGWLSGTRLFATPCQNRKHLSGGLSRTAELPPRSELKL